MQKEVLGEENESKILEAVFIYTPSSNKDS
jgi:hypothetical protein